MRHAEETNKIFIKSRPILGSRFGWLSLLDKRDAHEKAGIYYPDLTQTVKDQSRLIYKLFKEHFSGRQPVFSCLTENESQIAINALGTFVEDPLEVYDLLLADGLLYRKTIHPTGDITGQKIDYVLVYVNHNAQTAG